MSEVKQLQAQIAANQQLVKRQEQIDRLFKNKDFREVVLTEFCVNEAARYVATSADPALTPTQRQDALNLAQAGGHLKRWFGVQSLMASAAANEVHELSAILDEVRAEDNE